MGLENPKSLEVANWGDAGPESVLQAAAVPAWVVQGGS